MKTNDDNAVNEAITASFDERNVPDGDGSRNDFPAAIQEIGEAIFERYPDKTSIISNENAIGIIRCRVLNDYIQETTGVRYAVLDTIPEQKLALTLSTNGKGLNLFIEAIHGIQVAFENIAPGLMGRLQGR